METRHIPWRVEHLRLGHHSQTTRTQAARQKGAQTDPRRCRFPMHSISNHSLTILDIAEYVQQLGDLKTRGSYLQATL